MNYIQRGLLHFLFSMLILLNLVGCSLEAVSSTDLTNIETPERRVQVVGVERDALEINDLLLAGEFASAKQIIESYRDYRVITTDGYYAYDVLIGRLGKNPKLHEWVEPWLKSSPDESLAYLLSADSLITKAWSVRGSGYANTVAEEGWVGFSEYLSLAKDALLRSHELNSDDYIPARLMMKVEMGIGTQDGVESWFQRTVSIDPDYYMAYTSKAYAMFPRWGGDESNLINFINATIANKPRFYPLKLHWLHEEREAWIEDPSTREAKEALELILAVRKAFPDSALAQRRHAELLYLQGSLSEALALSRQAVETDPQSKNQYKHALYLYKNGQHKEALQHALIAVELNPFEDDHWILLGRIHHFGVYNYTKAAEYYSRAIELEAGLVVTTRKRGDTYLLIGEYEKAKEDFITAINIRSRYAQAYFGLGQAYHMLEDVMESRKAFDTAIEIDHGLQDDMEYFLRRN